MIPSLSVLLKEIWRGKSLPRIFLNYSLTGIKLEDDVLDLGSKSSGMSYNRFLKKGEGCRVTYTDLETSGDDVLRLDLEERYEIGDMSYDAITCFNTLEHVYNYRNVIEESYRILKPGGLFIGGTPFLVGYHPDPHDYFRYTGEALERMFTEAGFKKEKIVSLGMGPFVASFSQDLQAWPRILRVPVAFITIALDWVVLRLKKNQRGRFPLGYMFVFRK